MTDQDSELEERLAAMLASPRRLSALREFVPDVALHDTDLGILAEMAAALFTAPVSLVALVDADRQWFKAAVGTTEASAPVKNSFCMHTIAEPLDGAFVVTDATADHRFVEKPALAEKAVRFYVGVPIVLNNELVGAFSVSDYEPRVAVTPDLIEQLKRLSRTASTLLMLKHEAWQRDLLQAAISREEQRHAMALEAANVGSWLWDIRTGSVSCNEAMLRMFDLPQAKVMRARDIFSAIHPDDRRKTFAQFRAAMAEGKEYDGRFRIASTGRWLLGRGRVHERDVGGKARLFLGVNIDVTDEQGSSQRTRLLLRELNHRVKNTLAMLQSLARQTLRQTSDPKEFMIAFAGRLQSISEAHGLLSDREWGDVHLSALIAKQLSPHVRDYHEQIEIHKDEILLGPDQAIGLGLVLHELATNASKYGALSRPDGKIVLTARRIDEDGHKILHMTWVEIGGPPVTPPTRHGFGSILIERSLDKVMGSSVKVEYLPAGLTAIIHLPL